MNAKVLIECTASMMSVREDIVSRFGESLVYALMSSQFVQSLMTEFYACMAV